MEYEYASDTLQVLFSQESTTYRTNDYLKSSPQNCVGEESSSTISFEQEFEADSFDCTHMMVDTESCEHEAKKRKLIEQGSLPSCLATSINSVDEALRRQLWREKLCEWAYQVVDHFGLAREIVSISMNTFDRYCGVLVERSHRSTGLEEVSVLDKKDFALTAMTCLSLAIKLYEYKRMIIPGARSTMETILKLGRGSYSMEQIERKEYDVLSKLQWMVHPPTPQLFLHHLLAEFVSRKQHGTYNEEVQEFAMYLIEVSVLDYSFTSYKSSEIALAALMNSVESFMTKSHDSQKPVIKDDLLIGQLREHRTTRVVKCQQRLALAYAKAAGPATPDDAQMETLHHSEDSFVSTARIASPVSVTAYLLR